MKDALKSRMVLKEDLLKNKAKSYIELPTTQETSEDDCMKFARFYASLELFCFIAKSLNKAFRVLYL